jgi:hypothetical protein
MDLIATLERALMEGYATRDLNIPTVFLCVGLTTIIGIYIAIVYRFVNKSAISDRNFGLSLITLSIITSSIILTIQSNIVVSLGMVGALSIVRFRTAIKNPMDLIFFFWSISAGIICGAGFAMIAIIASLAMTLVIVIIALFHVERDALVLIVNTNGYIEDAIEAVLKQHCSSWKVRSRSITGESVNMAIEVRTSKPVDLLRNAMQTPNVVSASLLEHDGEISA